MEAASIHSLPRLLLLCTHISVPSSVVTGKKPVRAGSQPSRHQDQRRSNRSSRSFPPVTPRTSGSPRSPSSSIHPRLAGKAPCCTGGAHWWDWEGKLTWRFPPRLAEQPGSIKTVMGFSSMLSKPVAENVSQPTCPLERLRRSGRRIRNRTVSPSLFWVT